MIDIITIYQKAPHILSLNHHFFYQNGLFKVEAKKIELREPDVLYRANITPENVLKCFQNTYYWEAID